MGLKYDMFMVRCSGEELYEKIIALDWSFDVSEWMVKDREFDEERVKHLWRECTSEEDIVKYLKRPDDLQRYNDRSDKKWHFDIWWMDVPFDTKEPFCVGGYSRRFTLGKDLYLNFLLANLFKANVKQYMYMQYHHSSNEGSYMEVYDGYWDDNNDVHYYGMLESEAYEFEKYSGRVQEKSSYPVYEWHKYLQDLHGLIPWEYNVDLDWMGYFALIINTAIQEKVAKQNGGKEKTIECYLKWANEKDFIEDRMCQSRQSLLYPSL